jgi:hypothetical protein
MKISGKRNRVAWQPLTFDGVASFAGGSLGRLLLVESIVAVVVAVAAMSLCWLAWFPAIDQAIDRLPAGGVVRQARLEWPEMLPQTLADGPFLGIVVVGNLPGEIGQVADVQVELGHTRWKMRSLLGYWDGPYPEGWRIELDRSTAVPWWGARRPFLLAAVGVGALLALQIIWAALALAYVPVVALITYLLDRSPGWFGCWKLAFAALMPGALLMAVAMLLYALNQLPLVGLLGAGGLHLVLGWGYLLAAPLRLPRKGGAVRKSPGNPFGKGK